MEWETFRHVKNKNNFLIIFTDTINGIIDGTVTKQLIEGYSGLSVSLVNFLPGSGGDFQLNNYFCNKDSNNLYV